MSGQTKFELQIKYLKLDQISKVKTNI